MDGHTVPQETVLMTSAPYAYYAEAIAGGVNTEDINDGQITLEDLSDDVLAILNTDETGEPITTLDAAQVSFSAAIANGTGTDMESLIQSIDSVISTHDDRMDLIETDITNIEGDVDALETDTSGIETRLTTAEGNITTLQGDVTTLDTRVDNLENGTTLDDRYVNTSGDEIMTGSLTAASFSGSGSGLTSINGSQISSGTVADARIASTIARDSEIITDHGSLSGLTSDDHTQYFEKDGSDDFDGNFNMNDPVSCTATAGDDNYESDTDCLTIDGVDVSELRDRVEEVSNQASGMPIIKAWCNVEFSEEDDTSFPEAVSDCNNIQSVEHGQYTSGGAFITTSVAGDFKITFADSISGNYVFTGNQNYSPASNEVPSGPVLVLEKDSDYVIVRVRDSGNNVLDDVGFDFTIIGNQ